MANINLSNYFRKSSDIKSPVDSRIKLNKADTDKERWGDLRLDLKFNEIKERPLNAKESTHDLQRIINEESVIVALRNIFNTKKCSRLLNPEMNFEVSQYLFEPLTTTKAWFLGYDICTQLPQYDPRVKVNNVSVVAHVNEGYYTIDLFVGIPNISGDSVKVSALLSQDGFTIL